jgi:outer membrane protein OmpA-like peptidoglycan-associated protein
MNISIRDAFGAFVAFFAVSLVASACGSPPPPAPPAAAPAAAKAVEDPVATSSAPMVECDDEHVCKGKNERCQNGHCVGPDPGGPGCRDFGSPTFDFDSPELSESMKQTLSRLATCLVTGSLKGRKVLLTGHCDPRGENEYNMGLGATRSERAKSFIVNLGVPEAQVTTSSRGKLDAIGSEESTWQQDRRVDIEVR